MSEVQVKYQPPVIEYFDIRIDCAGMFHLRQTLKVALADLDVDPSIAGLIEALDAAWATGRDADPQVDDAAAAA